MKEKDIGRLVGGVAHDFNNMLSTIINNCDGAKLILSPHEPLYGYVDSIQQTSNEAARLVNQLLTFTRRAGNNPKVINVNDIINNNWKFLSSVDTVGSTIKLNYQPSKVALSTIKFDEVKLWQIILNLVINARDAIKETEKNGSILLKTENKYLQVDEEFPNITVPAGAYVKLSVRDNGTGISEDVVTRIFEPYFTTKNRGQVKGTGLGLATVQGILEEGGGFITVDTKEQEYTEFKIFIPTYQESEEEFQDRLEKEERIRQNSSLKSDLTGFSSILFVDDDDALRNICCQNLSNKGYDVVPAVNGVNALEIIDQGFQPDLIFTDVTMPLMDGLTLSKYIHEKDSRIPIIIASGFSEDSIPHELSNKKNLQFLPKPFNTKELIETIKAMIG